MGILSRIRGFFSSCIRPSTLSSNSSSSNEENSILTGSDTNSSHSKSSKYIASTSGNYGQSSRVRDPEATTISHHEKSNLLRKNVSRHGASTKAAYGTIKSSERTATTQKHKFDKPIYILKTFKTGSKLSPKGKPMFTRESDVIYVDEWTMCAAVILDESYRQLGSQHTVEISSDDCVEFRDCRLQDGCFYFSMKAYNVENITIFFIIKKYPDANSFRLIISKKICARYNGNSCSTAEMTIQRVHQANGLNICVFELHIVDVSGRTDGSFQLDIVSSGENEVIQKKRMVSKAGNIYFEITVKGKKPWSRDVAFILNGQRVPNAEKIEVSDKLKGLCHRALHDGESIPDFIELVYSSRVFIPLSVGDDDGKFRPYNEDNCVLLPTSKGMLCKDTKRDEILGSTSGFAHINNITRVLKLKDALIVHEIQADNVVIDLSNVRSDSRHICKELVQHLLRGLYYRRKASDAAAVRMEWKNRIDILAKLAGNAQLQSIKSCIILKDYFGALMNRYNRDACDELFAFFNFQREVCEVDLHGLYVANEKKLEQLRVDMLHGKAMNKEIDNILQKCVSFNGIRNRDIKYDLLNGKFSPHELKDFMALCRSNGVRLEKLKELEKNLLRRAEVDGIIEKFRSESNEAIRKLEITLESFDIDKAIKNNTPWLEIIVGAGHHSKNNEQSIRPKVEKFLKERNLEFAPVNKGLLVVTFLSYSGPEPCFGQYYCEKCDCRWKSDRSYVEKYQKCDHCQEHCWPLKQREKEKLENYYHL
jgi:hypothetical protein